VSVRRKPGKTDFDAAMKTWRRWLIASVLGFVLILLSLLLWLPSEGDSAPAPVRWKAQPDSLPLGTVLQGSTVEVTLGCLSDLKPPPPPDWIDRLPRFAQRPVFRMLRFRTLGQHRWKVRVEVPTFLSLDRSIADFHPTLGAFPTAHIRLVTSQAGNFDGVVTIRLSAHGRDSHVLNIPVKATVRPQPARWKVLITQTPFDRYSTEDGSHFTALADLTARLADQGVQVDFLEQIPKSLKSYDVVLLAEDSLAGLHRRVRPRIEQFVAEGGRLILAANAFFVGTSSNANLLLASHGLQMEDRDAGRQLQTSQIQPDALTAGISELSFFRPSRIQVTNPSSARILAAMEGEPNSGFLAVSRGAEGGEMVLLADSLWWLWIQPEGRRGGSQNARLFENLLAPREQRLYDPPK
jgi:hypothetical protein